MKNVLIVLTIVSLTGYLLILALFYFNQKNILFHPDQSDLKSCYLLNNNNVSYVEKNINGEAIRYLKYSQDDAKANLILFHGNAGSACDRGHFIEGLSKSPINIFLAEYPGYSADPDGEISQPSLLKNAQLVYDEINKEGLPIFLYGESLGTGPATFIASKNKIEGLLLNHPYTSISEVGSTLYPFLPIGLINKNEFPSKTWAKNVNVSPIVFQGDLDKLIPLENVELQIKNFHRKPTFIKIKGAGHNDILGFPELFKEANRYIQERLP